MMARSVKVPAITLRRLYSAFRSAETYEADVLVPMDPSHGATHDGALLAVLWNEGSHPDGPEPRLDAPRRPVRK